MYSYENVAYQKSARVNDIGGSTYWVTPYENLNLPVNWYEYYKTLPSVTQTFPYIDN